MDDKLPFRPFAIAFPVLAVLGWGGLALLLNLTLPTLWPRWGFFALLFTALVGTALPLAWYLNRRFPSVPPVAPSVVVRQSIWVGVYGATLAWLTMGRVLTFALAVGLAGGFIMIEYIIRMSERNPAPPAA